MSAANLAALLLGQAGDQPSDSGDAYAALAALPAENANRLPNPGFAGTVAPRHGETLDSWLQRLIERYAHVHKLDEATVNSAEQNLQDAHWSLNLSLQPPSAFVTWHYEGKTYRIDFLPLQPEFFMRVAPSRISRVLVIPFQAIAAAAGLLAASREGPSQVSNSESVASGSAAASESENAARPWQVEAANPSKLKALTADDGRSAHTQGWKYPTSRTLRKGQSDSESMVGLHPVESDNGHVSRVSP